VAPNIDEHFETQNVQTTETGLGADSIYESPVSTFLKSGRADSEHRFGCRKQTNAQTVHTDLGADSKHETTVSTFVNLERADSRFTFSSTPHNSKLVSTFFDSGRAESRLTFVCIF